MTADHLDDSAPTGPSSTSATVPSATSTSPSSTGATVYGDVHTTCADRTEADRIAGALVEQRLAACVQLAPVTSVFHWADTVEHDDEVLLIAKSRRELFGDAVTTIEHLHSYDLPAITFHPCEPSPRTAAWIDQSLGVDPNDT